MTNKILIPKQLYSHAANMLKTIPLDPAFISKLAALNLFEPFKTIIINWINALSNIDTVLKSIPIDKIDPDLKSVFKQKISTTNINPSQTFKTNILKGMKTGAQYTILPPQLIQKILKKIDDPLAASSPVAYLRFRNFLIDIPKNYLENKAIQKELINLFSRMINSLKKKSALITIFSYISSPKIDKNIKQKLLPILFNKINELNQEDLLSLYKKLITTYKNLPKENISMFFKSTIQKLENKYLAELEELLFQYKRINLYSLLVEELNKRMKLDSDPLLNKLATQIKEHLDILEENY